MLPMKMVSVLGLLVLLGLAWAMSFHRREVRLRPVLWGVGLQFLFALIILREDAWSFVGMVLLALLIAVYLFERPPVATPPAGSAAEGPGAAIEPDPAVAGEAVGTAPPPPIGVERPGRWQRLASLAAVVGVAAALYFLLPGVLGYLLLALLVLLVANGRWRFAPGLQTAASALFVMLGTAWLIARGFHGQVIFQGLSAKVAGFLNLSDYGSSFLFGNLANPAYYGTPEGSPWPGFGFQFAFKVLPTIIFFGGFMAVLYYLGLMQKVIESMARFMRWTIGTSGAETLSCSANMFVGQTEAPLLVKPFLDGMTRSELLTIMIGGFATIAGGVLAGYIALGVPAGHLIAASVMSAPAALVLGKIIYPEREHSQTAGDVKMPDIPVGGNAIEAAANGITDGLKLAVNVGAMLIGFIALIAVIDVLLNWLDSLIDGAWLGGVYVEYGAGGLSPAVGEFRGYFPGSLRTVFGTLLRPLAFLMGVPWADADEVGNLLGIKLSLNEFVAYGNLGTYIQAQAISPRAVIIATYALCGFANFSSIGIQIGGIAALAPHRKAELARLGLRAMFGGAIASWLTATIAGILIG